MKVVVTGSLGHIGKPLTTELVQKGHTVTVVSSNPEKQSAIEDLGATAAIGSLENPEFLAETFTGASAVFAMVPPNFAELDQMAYYKRLGRAYADAVRKSGVKRVVHLSSYGAHLEKGTGFILGAHHVENILNELPDVAVTHLRAGYFYYNLFNFAGMIKGAGFIGTNFGGDDKIALVAPSDIAAAAADELTSPLTTKLIRYVVSDEHTASETAQILGAAIGRTDLQWITFTDEQTHSALEKNGVPAPLAALLVEVGSGIHSGALLQDYELNKPITYGQVKLDDFATEFAAAF